MESQAFDVRPTRPIAPYVGGKRALSKRLVELIAGVPHTLYAEPFVGMGGVFFRRGRAPAGEVINDISADLVTLFRILQRHYQPFLDTLKWQLSSRAEWQRLMASDPTTLTDLERAARVLDLQRTSFGGRVDGRTFGVVYESGARFDLTKLVPMLEDVHDRPGALFYLDPPYHGSEHYYGPGVFSEADYDALRTVLDGLQARWIMSINDTPFIRAAFAGFDMEEVGLNYRLSGGITPARELIVMRL